MPGWGVSSVQSRGPSGQRQALTLSEGECREGGGRGGLGRRGGRADPGTHWLDRRGSRPPPPPPPRTNFTTRWDSPRDGERPQRAGKGRAGWGHCPGPGPQPGCLLTPFSPPHLRSFPTSTNLGQVQNFVTLPTRTPNPNSIRSRSPTGHHQGSRREPPLPLGLASSQGPTSPTATMRPLGEKSPRHANQGRTLPEGSQSDQASSDHYLPFWVDCDHCSNLSGREAAGEARRTVLGAAPPASGPPSR